jgi:hypothetical protein
MSLTMIHKITVISSGIIISTTDDLYGNDMKNKTDNDIINIF